LSTKWLDDKKKNLFVSLRNLNETNNNKSRLSMGNILNFGLLF